MTADAARLPIDLSDIALPELEALLDLSMRLGQVDHRLAQLEQSQAEVADGDPIAEVNARLDALDARMTTLERRQRRPPPFPVNLIVNEPKNPDPVMTVMSEKEPHPLVQKIWERWLNEQFEQSLKPLYGNLRLAGGEVARLRDRLVAVEALVAKGGSVADETNGG
jgi:hypothetical protein